MLVDDDDDHAESNHVARLVGACTMLVLLGVPWMFSAFAAIDSTGDANVQTLEAIFNVRKYLPYLIGYNLFNRIA